MEYEVHTSELETEQPDVWVIRAVEHYELDLDAPRPTPPSPWLAALLRSATPAGDGKRTRVLMTNQHGIPGVETLPGHWELIQFGELVAPRAPYVGPVMSPDDLIGRTMTVRVGDNYAIGGGGSGGSGGSHWAVSGGSGGNSSGAGGGGAGGNVPGMVPAALAVHDLIAWLNGNSRARNAGVRTCFRSVAGILEKHGYTVPELEDMPPARPHQASQPRKARKGKRRTRTQADRNRTAEIREWAKTHGYRISDNGRLPARVVTDYERENS